MVGEVNLRVRDRTESPKNACEPPGLSVLIGNESPLDGEAHREQEVFTGEAGQKVLICAMEKLHPGVFYHIYNRGNNGENLFREERNYFYFMKLYARYIEPVAETYAYCLLPNHFHLLVRMRDEKDVETKKYPSYERCASLAFGNLFSTYTKAINAAYQRHGSLFEKPFHRIAVADERYFSRLVTYIHRNPQTHGLVEDFSIWPFSSYQAILTDRPTHVQRGVTLGWFGGPDAFVAAHERDVDEKDFPSFAGAG